MTIRHEVLDIHPLDAILDTAQKKHMELIVLGTHGYSSAKRLLLGSVAENVVRNAKGRYHRFVCAAQVIPGGSVLRQDHGSGAEACSDTRIGHPPFFKPMSV